MLQSYPIAERIQQFKGEGAFEVLARAKELERQGRSIVHMEIGEPDFDTPKNICNAAVEALNRGETHYTPSQGLFELRETVADFISGSRQVSVDSSQVVITPGLKPMIFFCLMALVEPGDEVILPTPAYPGYESMLTYFGAKIVYLPLLEEQDFQFDTDTLAEKVSSKTKLIILNSPSNPTGGVLSEESLKAIAELAELYPFMVLSDEIYSLNIYGAEHKSIASIDGMLDRTLILDGFSKAYAMTGWRLGYAVCPKPIAQAITNAMLNTVSCVTTFVQWAGIEALTGDQAPIQAMVTQFRKRRDRLVEGLNQLPGFRCKKPLGAFYAFPNISETGLDCQELAKLFLEEAGVACLSGRCFGQQGQGFLRFSYATSLEKIDFALEKMQQTLKGRV